MQLEIPDNNLLSAPLGPAEAVRQRQNGVGAFPIASGRVAAPSGSGKQMPINALYPAYVPSNDLPLNQTLISGMGIKTNESCGDGIYKRLVHCSKNSEHDHYAIGGKSCGKIECPICWTQWAHRGADRISCRVDGFRQFARAPPRHIILSLNEDDIPFDELLMMTGKKALDTLKRVFLNKAELYGVTGGAMVTHLYRTNDLVPRDIPGIKKWEWVRQQGRENFFKYVEFEPHAHISGYGYLVQPKKGEFLYKNKGPLQTRDDIERWAYYSLSHASIVEGKTAVIYFGDCSNRKLKPVWIHRMKTELRCDICGAVMIYDDFNEVALITRTFADWVYSSDGFQDTRESKGPPLPGEIADDT
jgi:hypothetical protein